MQRAASVAWAFFVTPEEIAESRTEIVEAAIEAVDFGVTNMSDGTRSVSKDADAALKKLELLDQLNSRNITNPFACLRSAKIIPPGGG